VEKIVPVFGSDRREFIRHNVLTLDAVLDYPPQSMLRTDGTVWVTLVDVTATFGQVARPRNRNGLAAVVPRTNETWWSKPTNIYKITPAKYNDPDGFAAYVCPYADNSVNFKMLGSAADFMFTGDMDGCSFGIGMPNSNGDVRVGHSNAQARATGTNFSPNFGPQRTAQRQDLVTGGAGQAIVEPAAYRDNPPLGTEYKAVTVGLRIKGTWEFWYQHQNVDGMALRNLLGVTKL
jgi:hypothetical protein